ncbi:hypothetical protein [Nonomuraea dietziae]
MRAARPVTCSTVAVTRAGPVVAPGLGAQHVVHDLGRPAPLQQGDRGRPF